jgi:hypothetical protein
MDRRGDIGYRPFGPLSLVHLVESELSQDFAARHRTCRLRRIRFSDF